MVRRVLPLLILAALHAPATAANLTWTHPTAFTDGTSLAAADIVRTNIYCSADATPPQAGESPVWTTVQSMEGSAASGAFTLPIPRWCALRTVALLPSIEGLPREPVEGLYSAAVLLSPKTQPAAPAGPRLRSAQPFSCPVGATCVPPQQ